MSSSILIITSEFPPMPGGIGNHAYCLAKELNGAYQDVTVLTEIREDEPGEWQELLRANSGIRIQGLRRKRLILLTYLSRIFYAYRLIRQKAYAAVFFSGKFSVWLNAIMPRSKSVVVIHGSELKQRGIAKAVFRRGLKRARQIVCVSNFTRRQLISEFNDLDSNRIVVINNGINNDGTSKKTITNVPLDKKKVNLVTVGGIHRRKGQFNVVRALPSIVEFFPGVKYRIAGLPVDKEALKSLIVEEGVDEYVQFHHGFSDDEINVLLADSHIFMMLSEHTSNGDFEGFGIAVVEGMARGLPAIGSRESGLADAIKDGYSGLLVDPHDIGEVTGALKEILRNYEEYSGNAREWADRFEWKHIVKKYRSLIRKL